MQITVKESSSVTINQHSHNVSVEHTYTNTLQLLLFLRRSAPRPLYVLFSESEWRMIVLQNCKGRPNVRLEDVIVSTLRHKAFELPS